MLKVHNTFLHLSGAGDEEQPALWRARTAPAARLRDATEPDEQPGLSRETTFDEFEDPCELCHSDEVAEGGSDWSSQPDLSRDTTFDAFEVPCELGAGAACEAAPRGAQPGLQGEDAADPFTGGGGAAVAPAQHHNVGLLAPQSAGPPALQPTFGVPAGLQPGLAAMVVAPQVLGPGVCGTALYPAAWPSVPAASAAAGQGGGAQWGQAGTPAEAATPAPPRSGASSVSARPSKDVTCTYAVDGAASVRWVAEARRFTSQAATVVSPGFTLDLPGIGQQPFKIVVHAAASSTTKGGSSFRAAGGHARIELKCEGQLDSTAPSFDVSFGLGGAVVRGPLRHNFAEQSCCGLGRGEHTWDLLSAASGRTKGVPITFEIARAEGRA